MYYRDTLQETNQIGTIATVSKHIHFASKQKQEPPIKLPFSLPINFPDNIKEGLAKENLVGKPRSKFVAKIAEALYCQKSYSTAEEYRHVAGKIKKMAFSSKDSWTSL